MNDNKPKKRLDSFETVFSGILLLLITVTVLVQIAARLLGINASVTVELARFTQGWMVYIGMAGAVYANAHIGVMLLEKNLSVKVKIIRRSLIGVLTFVMLVFLAYTGTALLITTIEGGSKWTTADIPYFINHMALPLGSLLSMFRVVQSTIRDVKLIKQYGTVEIDDEVKCC